MKFLNIFSTSYSHSLYVHSQKTSLCLVLNLLRKTISTHMQRDRNMEPYAIFVHNNFLERHKDEQQMKTIFYAIFIKYYSNEFKHVL